MSGGDRSRIIVCDDQRDTALTLSMLLRQYGYEVFSCFDGAACLAKAQTWRPYAAILDIALPGLTGYEVAKGLRTLRGCENIVLIAVTGNGKVKDSGLAGFDWHFTKPAPPSSLLGALRHPDVTTNFGTRLR